MNLSYEENLQTFRLSSGEEPQKWLEKYDVHGLYIGLNERGEITYFEKELFGDPAGTFKLIDQIIHEINPKGLYTVPELGLENVPFEKVIEAVKERILKGITTTVSSNL